MNRYSAKLLFQWRTAKGKVRKKRRLCEEKIVTFSAESADEAYRKANVIGKNEEHKDEQDNYIVLYEFIGILELLDVTSIFNDGEVWYEVKEMVTPMERKSEIIPKKSELSALRKKAPNRKYQLRYP